MSDLGLDEHELIELEATNDKLHAMLDAALGIRAPECRTCGTPLSVSAQHRWHCNTCSAQYGGTADSATESMPAPQKPPLALDVIGEYGYEQAMFGLGLSHGITSGTDLDAYVSGMHPGATAKLEVLAAKLAHRDGGHNKFLESMVVWLDITATRQFWQQFDTYRVGVTKQSESTMHTLISHGRLGQQDFGYQIDSAAINAVNTHIANGDKALAKAHLPEAFLQRRVVTVNYKALRNMISQRWNHLLPEWRMFIDAVLEQVCYPEYITPRGAEYESSW